MRVTKSVPLRVALAGPMGGTSLLNNMTASTHPWKRPEKEVPHVYAHRPDWPHLHQP